MLMSVMTPYADDDGFQADYYDLMVCFTKWPRINILDKVAGLGASYRFNHLNQATN